jgi:hypothetical protein
MNIKDRPEKAQGKFAGHLTGIVINLAAATFVDALIAG